METETIEPEAPPKSAPPYFAFRTLLNTLEDMKKRGIPTRIDRTYLSGMSGAGQTQFIAGLRSLGLIDTTGAVQPELAAMVNGSAEERQGVMGDVLRRRYPEAVALGNENATTGQLVEVFRDYGATGDTARKAIAFYLQAAKYAGNVPLSPLFQTPKVSASGGATRRRRAQNGSNVDNGRRDKDEQKTPPTPDLHPALAGVLIELPRRGRGWTKERRDKFLAMFEMAVDFTIPIVDEEPDDNDVEEAETDEALTA